MTEVRVEKRLQGRIAPVLAARALPLPLTHAQRGRSRQRAWLADGRSAALLLPPGPALHSGALLVANTGELVRVVALPEQLLEASSADPHLLARAAYHLGNRHVPVDIAPGRLRLEPDTVLKALLARMGLEVREVLEPFEPEAGAYEGGHRHGHAETFEEDYALAQAAYGAHTLTPISATSATAQARTAGHHHDGHHHDEHAHDDRKRHSHDADGH